ncbi:alpha/beta fold hydrolase [Paenibacillus sp. GCM10027627]|uniref:alpha/beta fold hydrolase n=1 Tax=unclassified Paenibacillus TaxID=185978 RepID=UPI00363F8E6D
MAIAVFKSNEAEEKVLASYDRLVELWGVRAESHFAETRYGVTHCMTAGDSANPPLMLFHGVGDNSAVMWMLNMKVLSQRYYCIAVDTLGGPGKSVPNGAYKKPDFSQTVWINELLAYFELDSAYMAGVSNGAYMVFQYTTVHPEKVRKAVCLEGGIVLNPVKTMISTLLLMFPEILIPTDRNLLKVLKKMSSPATDMFEKHPLLAEHLILLMKSHKQNAMFPHPIEKYSAAAGGAVKDKLYFLLGDHRRVVKQDTMDVLEQGGYRYKVVPGAGHGINHEQPEAVHEEIFRFLSE